jgi:aminoglycoside 6-adenylyltransferase
LPAFGGMIDFTAQAHSFSTTSAYLTRAEILNRMDNTFREDKIIQKLIRWGEQRSSVRAMILTSTRTNPDAPKDVFSDYDVIVVVKNIQPYLKQDAWLQDFGRVLVVYRDPVRQEYGHDRFARITQYEDGTKIDFTIWPVEILLAVVQDQQLPDDLDVGYITLLDKDGLTQDLKAPLYAAYIPELPSEDSYLRLVEVFFHEATYVAKNLWRDELMPAKYSLDHVMKQKKLRQMLEWRMEIDHNWSLKPGAYGKGLKRHLPLEIWLELENTYVGPDLDENWGALFNTIDLFRKVAIQVGDHLGFGYPYDLERQVVIYLQKVMHLNRDAKSFF